MNKKRNEMNEELSKVACGNWKKKFSKNAFLFLLNNRTLSSSFTPIFHSSLHSSQGWNGNYKKILNLYLIHHDLFERCERCIQKTSIMQLSRTHLIFSSPLSRFSQKNNNIIVLFISDSNEHVYSSSIFHYSHDVQSSEGRFYVYVWI